MVLNIQQLTNILSTGSTREIFKAIAKSRTITRLQLKESFPQDDLKNSLEILKEAELVKEQPASIEDFDTLYVTANGLTVARELEMPSITVKF